MEARLTILGSSSATPTRTRFHSGQHFVFQNDQVLIDCGEGTQNRLLEYDINFQKIGDIFISHLHGDHYLGLPGLINTMALNQRTKSLNIYGPEGIKEILNLHFKVGQSSFPFELIISEIKSDDVIQLNSMSCEVIPVFHRIPCFGFLFKETVSTRKLNIEACVELEIPVEYYSGIKNGNDYTTPEGEVISNNQITIDHKQPFSYGYITDTLYAKSIVPRFKDVKVLYHEATYLDNLMDRATSTFHSTAGQAAEFANKASANQLIIGHYSSRYVSLEAHLAEARSKFPNTELAVEGQTFHLS
jgi:ribonuclease Z